jgi:hypothetical protein
VYFQLPKGPALLKPKSRQLVQIDFRPFPLIYVVFNYNDGFDQIIKAPTKKKNPRTKVRGFFSFLEDDGWDENALRACPLSNSINKNCCMPLWTFV